MERHYETICIIKSDIGEAAVKEIVKKATASLEKGGAEICKVDEWGRRRLAYPIEKKNEGVYVLFDYTSTPEVSKEMERLFKLNEDVVRYQTVRIETKAVVEAASEEDASAEAASEEGVASKAAPEEEVASKAAPEEDAASKAAPEVDTIAKAASAEGATAPDKAVSDGKGGEDD